MNTRPLYLALIIVSFHTVAHAELFKCKGANDRTIIQDTPCAVDTRAQDRKRPTPREKDDGFVQRKKDSGLGANWTPRPPAAQDGQQSPSQPAASTQADATKPPTATPSGASWQEKEQDYKRRRAIEQTEQTKAYNEQVRANNQIHECNYARQQLGVLKEGQRVYSRDNKGERQYLNDEKRQAEISAAEQRVSKACQ